MPEVGFEPGSVKMQRLECSHTNRNTTTPCLSWDINFQNTDHLVAGEIEPFEFWACAGIK